MNTRPIKSFMEVVTGSLVFSPITSYWASRFSCNSSSSLLAMSYDNFHSDRETWPYRTLHQPSRRFHIYAPVIHGSIFIRFSTFQIIRRSKAYATNGGAIRMH